MNNRYDMNYKNNIKIKFFFILITLTLFQQMPIIKDLYYNQIRIILYIAFGLFSINSLKSINYYLKIPMIKYFTLIIIYNIILAIILKIFGGSNIKIFDMIVPFGILICSLDTRIDDIQLKNIILWYIILSAMLGISSIFYYGEGFKITQIYFLEFKNQIGPILGSSTIICAIWILDKKQLYSKKKYTIIKLIVFFALISSIIIIRNRSGLIAIIITITLYILKEYRIKFSIKNILITKCILFIFVLLCTIGVFDGVLDSIWKSFTLNYDISDINSISAGRFDTYKTCIEFISKHPILGEIINGNVVQYTPHNYILNQVVNLGIIGSFPFLMLYIYIVYFVVKELIRFTNQSNFSIPIWILLFSIIVSLFEYTYPYGPGVSQIIVWFLIGQYCRKKYKINKNII